MRALLLIAGAALALGGCGKNDQSGAAQNADDAGPADALVAPCLLQPVGGAHFLKARGGALEVEGFAASGVERFGVGGGRRFQGGSRRAGRPRLSRRRRRQSRPCRARSSA